TNFVGSDLTVDVGRTINIGTLSTIDSTRFHVNGGASFSRVSAVSYNATTAFVNSTLFSADGAGSTLDLSVLKSFQYGTNFGLWTQSISATNGGLINLSNVTDIPLTNGEDDRLTFSASGGGTILLGGVKTGPLNGNTNDQLN